MLLGILHSVILAVYLRVFQFKQLCQDGIIAYSKIQNRL